MFIIINADYVNLGLRFVSVAEKGWDRYVRGFQLHISGK
jgi:hypothetical protein